MVFNGFIIGSGERLHVRSIRYTTSPTVAVAVAVAVAVKEFGFPQLPFRNHWPDSCLILPRTLSALRVSEARPNTLAFWSLPSTEPLTSRYCASIPLPLVHSRLTIHN